MLQSVPPEDAYSNSKARLDRPPVVGAHLLSARTHDVSHAPVGRHFVAGSGQQPLRFADQFFTHVPLLFEDGVDIYAAD